MEKPPLLPPEKTNAPVPANPARQRGRSTAAGCLLVVAIVLATIGAGIFFPFWFYPRFLPSGVYPRLLLALPIVLTGVAVAAAGSWLLKALGIPTIKEPDDDPKSD